MNNAEQMGEKLGRFSTNHPRIVKVLAWMIVFAIVAGAALLFFRGLAAGEYLKVAMISAIALFGGWRAYRQAKKTAES